MRVGTLIRVMIVLGWFALFIPHVVDHVAPGLGLDARSGTAATMAMNLGREYQYDLLSGMLTRLGTCRLGFQRSEKGFELETELRLDDLGKLAPGISLLPQLRQASARDVRLLLSQQLDVKQRLVSLTANGRAFGLDLLAEGRIGADGLRGTYTLGEGAATTYHLPDIGADVSQGSDLALNLPPGLKPGDRFTTRLLSPDYTQMRLSATTAIFNALTYEDLPTTAGQLSLLKVEMRVDTRVMSLLWCDADGTVYRSRQQDGAIELQLTQIREIGGRILWPPMDANP